MSDFALSPEELAWQRDLLDRILTNPSCVKSLPAGIDSRREEIIAVHHSRVDALSKALRLTISRKVAGHRIRSAEIDEIDSLVIAYQVSRQDMVRLGGVESVREPERGIARLLYTAKLSRLVEDDVRHPSEPALDLAELARQRIELGWIFTSPSGVEALPTDNSRREEILAVHRSRVDELSEALRFIVDTKLAGGWVTGKEVDEVNKGLLPAYRASRQDMVRIDEVNSIQEQDQGIAKLLIAARLPCPS